MPTLIALFQVLNIVVACHAFQLAAGSATERPTHFLVVRYDDYYARDGGGRVVEGIELEQRVLALFERYDATLVVGVVPFPESYASAAPKRLRRAPIRSWLDSDQDPWVRLLTDGQAKGVLEVALHGYEHRKRTPPGHRPGEFGGQPYAWQYDAIREGRDRLSTALGRPVRVFIPPWNSWDDATARALRALGFRWCSPDIHHADTNVTGLGFVPQCSADPAQVLSWIEDGPEFDKGTVIVLTTHPFDFVGNTGAAYFESLERLLAHVHARPDWRCVGFGALPEGPEAYLTRFRQCVQWNWNQKFLADGALSFVPFPSVPLAIYPAGWFEPRLPTQRALAVVVILAAGCAGAFVAWLVLRLNRRRVVAPVALAGVSLLLLCVLSWSAWVILQRGYHIRGGRWQLAAALAGASLVCILRAWRNHVRPRPGSLRPLARQASLGGR